MIVTDRFQFILNPKAASHSIVEAFGRMGILKQGPVHARWRETKSIRAVVMRDDDDRMRSGWRFWGAGKAFDEWLAGPDVEVAPGIGFKATPQAYWTDDATHVLQFDNFAADWSDFCAEMGLPDLPLKHFHRSAPCHVTQ